MIAQAATGIRHAGDYVRNTLMPAVDDRFLADDLRLVAQQYDLIAEEFDRAVDNLMRNRSELTALFEAAAPHLEGTLRTKAQAALDDTVDGFRVSDLTARADRDLAVFIELHAWIEDRLAADEPWAAALHQMAWAFLDARLERGRYHTVG